MDDEHNSVGRAIFLALCAFAAFSVSDTARKFVSLKHEISDILFWQAVVGMIMILCFLPFLGGVKALINHGNIKLHIVRGVLVALNTFFSLTAISQVPIMDAYTIFFLTPFVISILGYFLLKEKIGTYRFLSILCGFIGAFIAFKPGFNDINPAYIFAFICVFTFSSSSILVRLFKVKASALSFAFWPFLCLIVGLVFYTGGVIKPISDIHSIMLIVVIGCSYGFALIAMAYSYTMAPAAVISPYQYVQIIFAILFGYVFFGDVPDGAKILGAGIIISAGVFLFARERLAKKRDAVVDDMV
ncbi:MAG: DMT family transporter [Alphaproteobacteria bacterium]